jgi:hypothetical protein
MMNTGNLDGGQKVANVNAPCVTVPLQRLVLFGELFDADDKGLARGTTENGLAPQRHDFARAGS